MGWRDRLKPAAFRGIPFLFDEGEREGGRRLVEHVVPGRDLPIYEDLGRRSLVVRIRALILGADFDLEADRFEDALMRGREGELVLPTQGSIFVVVERYARAEGVRDGGGLATFEILFRPVVLPTARPELDPGPRVEERAAALESSAGTAVEEGTAASGVPEWVRDATAAAVEGVGAVFRGLRLLQAEQSKVLEMQSQVRGLIDSAAELATAPVTLAATILDTMAQIRESGMNAIDSLYAYRQFFGMHSNETGGASPLGILADKNRLLVTQLARAAAVAGALRSGSEAEFDSEEQAEEARAAIEREISALDDDADDETFAALQDLRVELRRSVPNPDLRPPATFFVTPPGTLPALVLASRYLDDPGAADRIVRANRIRHPLFVPAIPLRIVPRA